MVPLNVRRYFLPGVVTLALVVMGLSAWSSRSDTQTLGAAGEGNCPPIAHNDAAVTRPGVPVSIDVLANDVDVDGDPLVFTVTDVSEGTAKVDDNGTPHDTSDDALRYTPAPTPRPTATIGYVVSDPSGDTSLATVTVAITEDGFLPDGLRSDDPTAQLNKSACGLSKEAVDAATSTTEAVGNLLIDPSLYPTISGGATPKTGAAPKGNTSSRGATTTTSRSRTTTSPFDGSGGSGSTDTTWPGHTTTTGPRTTSPPTTRTSPSTTEPPCHDRQSCLDYRNSHGTTSTTSDPTPPPG